MRRTSLLITLLFLLIIPFAAWSQAETPLILWVRGDLYAVSDPAAAPVALTQNGTISGPALSPDGTQIAYKAAAAVGLDALSRIETTGFIAEFDLPGDIYLLDVPTQQTALVAAQPADASLFVEGVADSAIARSTPAWSPDGSALAWTEFDFGSTTPRLIIYDLATRGQTTLVEVLPIPIAMGTAPQVRWGDGGITIIGAAGELLIYSPDGALLSTQVLNNIGEDAPQEYAWVDAGEQSLFGVFYTSGRWSLLDPATGAEQTVNGVPVLVGAADDSLALRFGALPDVGVFWETVDPSGTTGASGAFPAPPSRVTLSPDGRQVAFIGYPDFGGVGLWRDGEVIAVTGTSNTLAAGAVLWGATTWRLGPAE